MGGYCPDSSVVPNGWRGSTYHNSSIQTYDDLAYRIKTRLGSPALQLGITDEQIATYIDDALEVYTSEIGGGFEKEYLLFCSDIYKPGCGIKVDELDDRYSTRNCVEPNSIYNEVSCDNDFLVTSSVSVSSETLCTYMTSGVGILSAWNRIDFPGVTGCMDISFNPNSPWDFGVCKAGAVELFDIGYPDDICLTETLDLCVNVSSGVGVVFPCNYCDLDRCTTPLSAWWGTVSATLICASATHIQITNVPTCTIEGNNAIIQKSPFAVKFQTCNFDLDTCGDVPIKAKFIRSFKPNDSLFNTKILDIKNNGFCVKSCTSGKCVSPTPLGLKMDVGVKFYDTSVSSISSVIVTKSAAGKIDPDLDGGARRKVVSVFNIEAGPHGYGESGAFGFFDAGYNMFGNAAFVGTGNPYNVGQGGYDILTHEMWAQFVDTANIIFDRNITYDFNVRTQMLRIYPEPDGRNTCGCRNFCGVIGLWREKPLADLLSRRWVREYALALTMIGEGLIRNRYEGVTIAGTQITNSPIYDDGIRRRDELMDELKNEINEESQVPAFRIG